MDKRFQVFVSSKYVDLQDERQEVIQALLELDCIPAGMELFPAADEDQWTLIKKAIDDCDYYIVVVGGRYGSLSPKGISYTQMEYEYALSKGKPTIGFLHKDPGAIPASKTEQTEQGRNKLELFRALVQKKTCKYWISSSELGSVVSRSVVKLIKSHPAIGWVRADQVLDENSSKDILRLQKRVGELESILEKTRTEGPKGTEALAQGEDSFEVRYTYELRYGSDLELLLGEPERHTGSLNLTWNQLFAALAPHMIDEATEHSLRASLDQFVKSREVFQLQDRHPKDVRVVYIRVTEDYFQFQSAVSVGRIIDTLSEFKYSYSARDLELAMSYLELRWILRPVDFERTTWTWVNEYQHARVRKVLLGTGVENCFVDLMNRHQEGAWRNRYGMLTEHK